MVQAHDPAVKALPPELMTFIRLYPTALDAADQADALVLATPWPDYQHITPDALLPKLASPIIIDISRFLLNTLGSDTRLQYHTIGRS